MSWKPKPPKRLRARKRNKIVKMFDAFTARPLDHPRSDRPERVVDIIITGKLADFNNKVDTPERQRSAVDMSWAAAATTRLDAWRHQTFAIGGHQIIWSQRMSHWNHTDLAWLYNATDPDNMMWFSVRATTVDSFGPDSEGFMRNVVSPVVTFSAYEFASWVAGLQDQHANWRKAFYKDAADLVGEDFTGTLSSRFAILTRLWAHRVLHGQTLPAESAVFNARVSPALARCDISQYFGGL